LRIAAPTDLPTTNQQATGHHRNGGFEPVDHDAIRRALTRLAPQRPDHRPHQRRAGAVTPKHAPARGRTGVQQLAVGGGYPERLAACWRARDHGRRRGIHVATSTSTDRNAPTRLSTTEMTTTPYDNIHNGLRTSGPVSPRHRRPTAGPGARTSRCGLPPLTPDPRTCGRGGEHVPVAGRIDDGHPWLGTRLVWSPRPASLPQAKIAPVDGGGWRGCHRRFSSRALATASVRLRA
jgi:hypothetical protein